MTEKPIGGARGPPAPTAVCQNCGEAAVKLEVEFKTGGIADLYAECSECGSAGWVR
jgi:uncharacterized Zn finger protein